MWTTPLANCSLLAVLVALLMVSLTSTRSCHCTPARCLVTHLSAVTGSQLRLTCTLPWSCRTPRTHTSFRSTQRD